MQSGAMALHKSCMMLWITLWVLEHPKGVWSTGFTDGRTSQDYGAPRCACKQGLGHQGCSCATTPWQLIAQFIPHLIPQMIFSPIVCFMCFDCKLEALAWYMVAKQPQLPHTSVQEIAMAVGCSTALLQRLCEEKRAAVALPCLSLWLQSTLKLQFMCCPDHRYCDNPHGISK